jgi:arylsulfatase A-like enzyme
MVLRLESLSRGRLLAHSALVGLQVGVLAGVCDALISRNEFLGASLLWASVLGWVALWLPMACLLGLIAVGVYKPGPDSGWRSGHSLAAAVTITAMVASLWFLLLVQVNVIWLGTATSLSSLLADAGFTVAALAVAVTLWRLLTPAIQSRWWLQLILFHPALMLLVAMSVLVATHLSWHERRGAAGPPQTRATAEQPNVVVILIDTLRRDHLSGEGYPRQTSPYLDRLADRGARFTGCLSQSSYTKPSVASLLTSTYLSGHGAGNPNSVLSGQHLTVVEAFHQAGYRTAMVVANPTISEDLGFAQGAELFHTLESLLLPRTRLGYGLSKLSERGRSFPLARTLRSILFALEQRLFRARGAEVLALTAPEVADAFVDWQLTIADGPYFAYLHLMEPHAPYAPPLQMAGRFSSPDEPFVATHPPLTGVFLPFNPSTPLATTARNGLIRAYDAEIAYTDQVLERLISQIQNRSGPAGTLIAVTSDHGEEMFEHQAWGHGHSLHRELLEVPLLLIGPGLPQGLTVEQTVELIDLTPTLLELTGVPVPQEMAGRSLVPLLRAEAAATGPEEAFSELFYAKTYWARALQHDRRKLIVSRLGERRHVALFDLDSDPLEHNNIAEQAPEVVQSMLLRIDELVAAAEAARPAAEARELDATTRERLRALGYIE